MKKVWILTIVLLMSFALSACNSADYKKAMELYNEKNYTEAKTLFTELGDYEDSALMVLKCDYNVARTLYEKDDLVSAVKLLAEMPEYMEATDLLHKIMYDQANDGLMPEIETATKHFSNYTNAVFNEFRTEAFLTVYSNGDGFTVTPDYENKDVVASNKCAGTISEQRIAFMKIFPKAIIDKCDNEMQAAYNAYMETSSYAASLFFTNGIFNYITSCVSSISTSAKTPEGLASLVIDLEHAIKKL